MNDEFIIRIGISADVLRSIAESAVHRSLNPGREGFRDVPGAGYTHINNKVLEAIKALDLTPIISAALDEVLTKTVAETMAELVKAEVKRQVKQIKANNEL